MIIIKADTLELAMEEATAKFECSVIELQIEVIEEPKGGVLGFFKKQAVIAVIKKSISSHSNEKPKAANVQKKVEKQVEKSREPVPARNTSNEKTSNERTPFEKTPIVKKEKTPLRKTKPKDKPEKAYQHDDHIDMFAPSLVTAQDEYEEVYDENEYKKSTHDDRKKNVPSKEEIQKNIAKAEEAESSIKRVNSSKPPKSDVVEEFFQTTVSMDETVKEVDKSVNQLFSKTCFDLNVVKVSSHDENTLLIEFTGNDAALLIGKEGYRYKALSYMLFNWINSKYNLQLRLEIAEFLKNQEEIVHKYLKGLSEQVHKNGRAQTKILDGVLVQIALKKLRTTFPEKYVAIRTNRDGLKYIIINSFRSNNG